MFDKILLNNAQYNFNEEDLPCLITYAPKTGGSQFSVSLTAQLFNSGSKILFFTAYPMATDNFLELTQGKHDKIKITSSIQELDDSKQVIMLKSGDEKLFNEALNELSDINERVVLIKNMEQFSSKTIEKSLRLSKLIFSGDIDNLPTEIKLNASMFNTIIAFSQPNNLAINVPENLEKYAGFYMNKNGNKGIVTLNVNP